MTPQDAPTDAERSDAELPDAMLADAAGGGLIEWVKGLFSDDEPDEGGGFGGGGAGGSW